MAQLTITGTIERVRSLGLTCTYNSSFQEFTVNYKSTDPRYRPGNMGTSYYTADADDAVQTAIRMARGDKA